MLDYTMTQISFLESNNIYLTIFLKSWLRNFYQLNNETF